MSTPLKLSIREHYDTASELYREFWGIHIHHGYWADGTESKEHAQERMIEFLAEAANVSKAKVLDVGCGIGGTAIHLTRHFGATVTGITISPVQAQLAAALALDGGVRVHFMVMDAEELSLSDSDYDVVWAMESISHLEYKKRFFTQAASLLKSGGRFAIVDWFKAPALTVRDERTYIDPIVRTMLIPELCTFGDYVRLLQGCGCRITATHDVSSNAAKTWDLCLPLARLPRLLQFARNHGAALTDFLKGFKAMRAGFRSGTFRYGAIVAEKT